MDLFDKLYQKAEEYALANTLDDAGSYTYELEQAFRAGAEYGYKLAQEQALEIRGIQG